jgi:hypothetical protein
MATTWTPDDSQAAMAEGWDVFAVMDVEEPWQIQRLDDPAEDDRVDFDEPKFDDDVEVWRHLVEQAAAGSPLHQKALDFMAEHNPAEWDVIVYWTEGEGQSDG